TTGAPTAATTGDHTTLADLVRIAVLDGTRLVPARAPLDAAVTSLVLADPGAPAEPGALVLCPGPPPAPLPEGCVGVLCRTPPPTAIGVPALVLPPGTPWGEVIAGVAAAITGGRARARADRARAALRVAVMGGRGHPGVAETASGIL